MKRKKHLKNYLIDDLQKLDDLIKDIEINDKYNSFDQKNHEIHCEKLRDFHSYWSIHSKQI